MSVGSASLGNKKKMPQPILYPAETKILLPRDHLINDLVKPLTIEYDSFDYLDGFKLSGHLRFSFFRSQ